MAIRPLTDVLSISPQIAVSDREDLSVRGFRSVINTHPDGEEPGQPDSAGIAPAANEAGLAYRYLPVIPGQLQDSQIDGSAEALACRPLTGTRSATPWTLRAASGDPVDEALARTRQAGYDLAAMARRLAASHRSRLDDRRRPGRPVHARQHKGLPARRHA